MGIKLQSADINTIKLGINNVSKMYLGTNEVFNVAPPTFLPSDISGLYVWYDADTTVVDTITHVGGSVSAWLDKSTNGYDLLQANSSNQPSTGVRTQNGLNVINIDDDNQRFMSTGLLSDYPPSATIFIFGIVDVVDNFSDGMFTVRGAGSGFGFHAGDTTIYRYNFNANSNTNSNYSTLDQSGVFRSFVSRFDLGGTSLDLYVDGGSATIGAYTTSITSTPSQGISIGQNRFYSPTVNFDGAFGEIIIYDRPLSASEINQVGNYGAVKWGTAWVDVV